MPEELKKLAFKPGINRDQTNYASEGGWYECQWVRFRSGFPEKMGGWKVASTNQYDGVCRSIFPYATYDGTPLLGISTNSKQYVALNLGGATLHDITPLRATYTNATTPSTNNCFTTTDSSATVTVTFSAAHNAKVGDYVTFSGLTSPIGGVAASKFNQEFKIISVPSTTTFTIILDIVPTTIPVYPTAVSGAGGIGVTAAFQIHVGNENISSGYGWGAGGWGGINSGYENTGWGSASAVGILSNARLVFQDRYSDTLYFNIQDATGGSLYDSTGSNIFYWDYDSTYATRALRLDQAVGASYVPQQVGKIMFAPSGHLLALGCTDITDVYDPLLIRWANVDPVTGPQPQDWLPTAINTAGDLRVASGSKIITGFKTRQEILIYTDFTVNSLQFLGTAEIFGLQELANNTSIIGPNTVTSANNIVYWMGVDKFYLYSGRVDTVPCTLRQFVFQSPGINTQLAPLFVAGGNAQFNEVMWLYADSTSNTQLNRYVIFNYSEQIWYYGEINRTYWTDDGYVVNPVAARDGWIYQHESGVDDGGPGGTKTAINAYISSADFDIDDGYRFMLMRKIIPDINFTGSTASNATAYMTVGVRNFPGASISTTNQESQTTTKNVVTTATIDQYTNQVFIRARGRQMNFTIGSNTLGTQWQLGFPRLEAREDGRRGGENP